jgi:hypothetical protein
MDAQSVRAWTIECRGSASPVVRDMTWYPNASASTAARSVRQAGFEDTAEPFVRSRV